ncbi:hypothetical protein [Kiloniella sp.]|uniref:hypothetical protein n=1 Tax=Kiloniella sp. TaxID=1938587 RepID=UPI003B029C7E
MIKKVINLFGDKKYEVWRRWALLAALFVVFVADFLVDREHGEFFWDHFPGWWAGFGFVSCVVIIVISKVIGHQGRIMRYEDYYD